MDAWLQSFGDALRKGAGEAIGAAIVWITVLVFVATFLFVLYLFGRTRGIDFRIHLDGRAPGGDSNARGRGEAPGSRPGPAPLPTLADLKRKQSGRTSAAPPGSDDERKKFLRSLDTAEQVLAKVMIVLLIVLFLGATAIMAALVFAYPDDGFRDFMLFYGTAVYLFVLLALGGKLYATWQRLRPREAHEGRTMLDELRSKMSVTIESAEPEVFRVDAGALERARDHVRRGGSIDEACELADPRYKDLNGWSKTAFRKAVEMAIQET